MARVRFVAGTHHKFDRSSLRTTAPFYATDWDTSTTARPTNTATRKHQYEGVLVTARPTNTATHKHQYEGVLGPIHTVSLIHATRGVTSLIRAT